MRTGWAGRVVTIGASAALAVAAFAAGGLAQQQAAADPQESLSKARDTYDAAVEKAKGRLLAALEKRVEAAKASGKPDAVDEMKGIRERYLADGNLPDSPKVAAEVRSFRSEWRLAARAYIAAIQKAESALTKADRLDEARQLQRERAVLESELAEDNPAPITAQEDPAAQLQPNTVWKGFMKGVGARAGQAKKVLNASAVLRVVESDGRSFRGTFAIQGGPGGMADVEGGVGKVYRTRDGTFREFTFMITGWRGGRGPVGPATTYYGSIKGDNISAAQRVFRNSDAKGLSAVELRFQSRGSR